MHLSCMSHFLDNTRSISNGGLEDLCVNNPIVYKKKASVERYRPCTEASTLNWIVDRHVKFTVNFTLAV